MSTVKDVFLYKDGANTASIKDVDGKKGIVTGYFAAFDNEDSDRDIIRRGAFVKTIQENGPSSTRPRIKHLLNHDNRQPLGKLLDLKEDQHGVYYESQIGDHNLGQDFIKMIESGLITEHSIGFNTIKRNQIGEWDKPGAVWEITEVKLWEGSSLTAWGANPNTPLTGMKSKDKALAASKRIELLSKAIKNGTFTDENFELLEIELKQLQQLFIDLTKDTTEPIVVTATQPGLKEDNDWIEQLKSINQLFKANDNGRRDQRPADCAAG